MQKKTFKLLWAYSRPYAGRRNFALINSAITVVASSFIGPLVLSQLFTQLQSGHITLASSWGMIAAFALAQLYGEVIGWRLNLYATWTFETAAQRDIYCDIFSKLSRETMQFHADRFGGSLVSQSGKLNGAFERMWDTAIFQAIPSLTSIVAAVSILSFVFWQYAVALLIISITFGLVVYYGSKFMRQRNIDEAQAGTKMTGWLADMVTNIATVKAYARESDEHTRAQGVATTWRGKSLSVMRGFLGLSSLYSTLIIILTITCMIASIYASEHRLISIGIVYLALSYTFTVARQLWEMNNIMRSYNRIIGDAHDMVEILTTPTALIDHGDKTLEAHKGHVTISDMRFSYGDNALFDAFSLDIPAGQRVGIVGHSGSGKTTLTKLLLRFADIDGGTIAIDGVSIRDVTQASLHRAISYVPQEPMLFHRSLRENIAYGKPDATDAEVIRAAKKANAWEFIQQLPEGLDTTVGERGVKLSGGQRQRIAIARAILKNAPILILDEATSALDSESEKLIQASLDTLMKGRTSIVIAHRLSTIAKLDRIVVLDKGSIVEDGSHNALIAAHGTYAKLWQHQSGGFIEE